MLYSCYFLDEYIFLLFTYKQVLRNLGLFPSGNPNYIYMCLKHKQIILAVIDTPSNQQPTNPIVYKSFELATLYNRVCQNAFSPTR